MRMNKDTIRESCLIRWQDRDERTDYFEKNLPDTIEHMNTDMQTVFFELLNRFDYYSHQYTNSQLINLHTQIMNIDGVELDNSVFSVLKSQSKNINSSYEYWMEYRMMNQLSKYSCIPELGDLNQEEWSYISNVVLIDDFCGSGNTLTDFISQYKPILQDKHVIYAVIHCMSRARTYIEDYARKEHINISVISVKDEQAAFDLTPEIGEKRELFAEESKKLGLKKESDIYGYEQTEALVAFHNDTPNNTLGIFWKDTDDNTALFPRKRNEKPGWKKMANRKRRQKEQNYQKEKQKRTWTNM